MNSISIPLIVVFIGSVIILLSLKLSLNIRKLVPEDMRWKWMAAIVFMAFFLSAYAAFLLIMLNVIDVQMELVAGVVFLGGAIFVYLVIKLTRTTIRRINEKDRDIEDYARGLTSKTAELEREITDRIRAQEEASSRLQYLSALHEIDMLISSSLDVDFTLKGFLDQAVSHLKVDAACVLLLNSSTQTLNYAAGLGFNSGEIEKTSMRLGEGSAGVSALERRTVTIPDLRTDASTLDRGTLAKNEGFVFYSAVPLIAKGQVKGVFEIFNRSTLKHGQEWNAFLKALTLQAAIALDNISMFNSLQRFNAELILAYDTTLEGWSRALELRDEETEGHTQRVVETTVRMAIAMGIKDEALVHVRRGALLHDIGKMSIPDSILKKAGQLTEDEWQIMRRHPTNAFELLSPIAYLRPALDIPYCHHEKWDGTGYPRKLKGEQIPLAARIFAVVDMWDALRSERRYHPAWPRDKACEHIKSLSGIHFDPEVVKVFLELECK